MIVSIAVTTFNEDKYLDWLLQDLSKQKFEFPFEIILVEAGDYQIHRAKINLGVMADKLIFLQESRISRTKALNLIMEIAKGDLIVRLDARSHIDEFYLKNIYCLSLETRAANVGGIMLPIGKGRDQATIAEIMKHPLSFGGAKARRLNYRGFADSVYLGAFCKEKCIPGGEWFDTTHPRISEDSDLNYRLRKNGGSIFVDSSIIVKHYPRESLRKFFKLCFNYGVGRGLFFLKTKTFSAYRQLVPPLSLFLVIIMLIIGSFNSFVNYLLLILLMLYFSVVTIAATSIAKNLRQWVFSFLGFVGCHLFWTLGLIASPLIYKIDLKKSRNLS